METWRERRVGVRCIAWLDVCVELLVKSEFAIVSSNAALVKQIVNRPLYRVANGRTAVKTTRWIGEAPTPTGWCRTQRVLKSAFRGDGERPRTLGAEKGLKRGIVAAPYQGKMTCVVVEKALVAESGVIRIRLIEDVGVSACAALDDRALDKGLLSQVALLTSNETKMSDGGRQRASLGVEVWRSSQKWSAQRSAVRSIAWLDADVATIGRRRCRGQFR